MVDRVQIVHTPPPYEVRNDLCILQVGGPLVAHTGAWDRPDEENEANARFLCHAANCHQDLITALEDLLGAACRMLDSDPLEQPLHDLVIVQKIGAARAVLERARAIPQGG